jgi:hypothetical protein
LRAVDRFVETETVGNLLIRWIAQERIAAANQYRDIGHRDVEASRAFPARPDLDRDPST